MKKLHTVDNWFWKTGKYTGLELLQYFEKDFKENMIGKFKAPYSIVKIFNNFETEQDRAKCINALGQTIINMIVGSPIGRPLRKVPFSWVLEEDMQELRTGLCLDIQHLIQNRQFWEKVNQSSLTTGTFTINSDANGWLLNVDTFGQFSKTALENSGIDQYEYMNDAQIVAHSKTGNIIIVGTPSDDAIKKLEI